MLINPDRCCWGKPSTDTGLSSLPAGNKPPYPHSVGVIHVESLAFYPLPCSDEASLLSAGVRGDQWESECSLSPRDNEVTLSSMLVETTRGTRTPAQPGSNKDHPPKYQWKRIRNPELLHLSGSNKTALSFLLIKQCQRKPVNRKGLNKIQSFLYNMKIFRF